jgi:hypothetical protein
MCLTVNTYALELHVSPQGNDSWSGTRANPNTGRSDGPFATPKKALDAIRAHHQANGVTEAITVTIQEGTYYLDKNPLTVKPIHSGTEEFPVTIRAAQGAQVVISGGFPISNWTQKGNLLVTSIDTAQYGSRYFRQLFVGNQRRTRARMPNKGDFFRIEGGFADRPKGAIKYAAGDCKAWDNFEEANIVLYNSWTAVNHWIKSVDEASRRIDFARDMWWEVGKWEQDQRYYVENVFEALDTAGEWYLNPSSFELSYYPLPGETAQNLVAVAPRMSRVLLLEGDYQNERPVEYVSFEGITFAHADWRLGKGDAANGQAHVLRDDAVVYGIGAQHCSFTGCRIGPGGAHGVALNFGSAYNRVEQSEIHGLGGGGVYMTTLGMHAACKSMSTKERIHHNTVDNCYLHDMGHVFHGSVGVLIGHADNNTISHNDICDIDYTGISVGWCWGYNPSAAHHNVIEYNRIHHLGQGELSDMGGVYTLGLSDGTVVRNNLIHDVYAYTYGGWGLYTDQASSNILMENNIVHDVKSHGFHQHFGKLNTIRNNIFAFAELGGVKRSRQEDHRSFIFEKNIVYVENGIALDGNYTNDNFLMDNNVYWATDGMVDFGQSAFGNWQARGHDRNSRVADPLFVDAAGRDFRLRAGSPALDLGISPIDVDQIGLYGDASWRSRPAGDNRRGISPYMKLANRTLFSIHDFLDGFEDTPVGSAPHRGKLTGAGTAQPPSIAVTDTRARDGKRSLRIADSPTATHSWEPVLIYEPKWYHPGTVTVSFDIFLEEGARINHEWRDKLHGYPDNVGIALKMQSGLPLEANGKKLDTVAVGSWMHFQLQARIDTTGNAKYDLTARIDGETITEKDIAMRNAGWHVFSEAYFVSSHSTTASSYIDNLHFVYEPDESVVRATMPPASYSDSDGRVWITPRNGMLHIALPVSTAGDISLIAANGRTVLRRKVSSARDTGPVMVDTRKMAPGVYTVRVQLDNQVVSRRFVRLR